MLKQLKETKHGAPWTAVEDVPTHLRPTAEEVLEYTKDATTDEHFFERWDWVLDEMIHAFEQKCTDDWVEQDVEEQKRISNGFRLFGKYYENLWD